MNRHARSFFRQFQRDAPANAPGTPRDQDFFSLERHTHLHDCRAACWCSPSPSSTPLHGCFLHSLRRLPAKLSFARPTAAPLPPRSGTHSDEPRTMSLEVTHLESTFMKAV